MKVGIVGCGLMGRRRARSLRPEDQLVAVYDTNTDAAGELALKHRCMTASPEGVIAASDAVIVAVPTGREHPYVSQALHADKWVLLEKPGGFASWALPLNGDKLRVGYTMRFHPGVQALRRELDKDPGKIQWIKGTLGHGGNKTFGDSWRVKDRLACGELLDQGCHLLDLAGFVTDRDVSAITVRTRSNYWRSAADDASVLAILLDEQARGEEPLAMLHASWTMWEPAFRFEVATSSRYYLLSGIAPPYGHHQTLSILQDVSGEPAKLIYIDNWGDVPGTALENEWLAFVAATEGKTSDIATTLEAKRILRELKGEWRL